MPQDYSGEFEISSVSMVNVMDIQWRTWRMGLTGFNTNAIKPIIPSGQGYDEPDIFSCAVLAWAGAIGRKMELMPDSELLRDYARTNRQEAFAELVRRHVDLVYSTALRRVNGDAQLAQDAAQTVFIDLARKAAPLSRRASLGGWLYTSAYFAAAKMARTEHRRRDREEQAMREPTHDSAPEADWESIRPALDDAMHELKEADREALVLRYFENRPFAEVGAKLGLNENAARMRVERALEKLRLAFARRGVATSAGLAAAISAHAVQSAPTGLAVTLTTASVASSGTGTLTVLKLMTAAKFKLGLGALVIAGAATTLVVQHQAQQKQRAENESLRQEIAQLKASLESAPAELPPRAEPKPLPDDQMNELLRLRGEVAVLRRQTNELRNSLAEARNAQAGAAKPSASGPSNLALPEDYPKTPDGATRGIFEAWAKGDWDGFFTKFGEPGVPRETYDRAFNEHSNYLRGLEIVSIGEPTNGYGPNMWFVPYKIRFQDGSEKEFRLSVKQDPRSGRYWFDGGF